MDHEYDEFSYYDYVEELTDVDVDELLKLYPPEDWFYEE